MKFALPIREPLTGACGSLPFTLGNELCRRHRTLHPASYWRKVRIIYGMLTLFPLAGGATLMPTGAPVPDHLNLKTEHVIRVALDGYRGAGTNVLVGRLPTGDGQPSTWSIDLYASGKSVWHGDRAAMLREFWKTMSFVPCWRDSRHDGFVIVGGFRTGPYWEKNGVEVYGTDTETLALWQALADVRPLCGDPR